MSDVNLNDFTKEMVTSTVRMRLLSCGIVHYTYLPNSEVDEKEHQLNHNALVQLIGKDEKFPLLIDADQFINVTPEARKLVRQLEATVPISARAMIITSLGQRILASFFIKIQKPIVPTKIFNNYPEGIEWLKKISELRRKKNDTHLLIC
jgi:hypothetical protein